MVIWLVLVGLSGVMIALWLPLRVKVQFQHANSDQDGSLSVSWLFGLIHVTRKLTSVEVSGRGNGLSVMARHGNHSGREQKQRFHVSLDDVWREIRRLPYWRELFRTFWPIVRALLGRVVIQEFSSKARVGAGDAAFSAVLAGMLWAISAAALEGVCRLCDVREAPVLQIVPDFHAATLEVSIQCIVRIRFGYAIWAGLRLIWLWRRQRRGTPYPRAHADSYV